MDWNQILTLVLPPLIICAGVVTLILGLRLALGLYIRRLKEKLLVMETELYLLEVTRKQEYNDPNNEGDGYVIR